MTVCPCRQLQAGARVLDVRLAINPWLAVSARAKHTTTTSSSSTSTSTSATSGSSGLASHNAPYINTQTRGTSTTSNKPDIGSSTSWYRRLKTLLAGATLALNTPTQPARAAPAPAAPAAAFNLDPVLLEGALNMAAVGGPLTAAERQACIVTSHSLPGAPLVQVLADVRRFLAENPGEVSAG